MSLFKYVPIERLDILLNQKIRYTQPGAFNDPFEMPAYLEKISDVSSMMQRIENQIPKELEEFYSKLESTIRSKLSIEALYKFAETRKPIIAQQLPSFLQEVTPIVREKLKTLDKMIGILSMTETPDNLIMWAHYADQHRGMVIEFDEKHATFNERRSSEDDLRHLRRVIYTNERPVVSLENLSVEQFILTKSTEWQHETEWRILKSTDEATQTITGSAYEICLFDMPAAAIRGIILGARVSDERRQDIKKILSSTPHLKHIEIKRALLRERQFGLLFEKC